MTSPPPPATHRPTDLPPTLVAPHAAGQVLWTVLSLLAVFDEYDRIARPRGWAKWSRWLRSTRDRTARPAPATAPPAPRPRVALARLAQQLVPDDWPPAVQPISPDGHALVPLLFARLDPGDVDEIAAAVDYVLAGHAPIDDAFQAVALDDEDADILLRALKGLADLVRLGWNEDGRIVEAALNATGVAVNHNVARPAAETTTVPLTEDAAAAYRRLARGIVATWHHGDELEALNYRC